MRTEKDQEDQSRVEPLKAGADGQELPQTENEAVVTNDKRTEQALIDALDALPDMVQRESQGGKYVSQRWVRLHLVIATIRKFNAERTPMTDADLLAAAEACAEVSQFRIGKEQQHWRQLAIRFKSIAMGKSADAVDPHDGVTPA